VCVWVCVWFVNGHPYVPALFRPSRFVAGNGAFCNGPGESHYMLLGANFGFGRIFFSNPYKT
jgi:hypothetical protein